MLVNSIFGILLVILIFLTLTPSVEAGRRRGRGERGKITSGRDKPAGPSDSAVSVEKQSDASGVSQEPGSAAAGAEDGHRTRTEPCKDCGQAPIIKIKVSSSRTAADRRHRIRSGRRHRTRDYRQRARDSRRGAGSSRTAKSDKDAEELKTKSGASATSVSRGVFPQSPSTLLDESKTTDDQEREQSDQVQLKSSQSRPRGADSEKAANDQPEQDNKNERKNGKSSTKSRKRKTHSSRSSARSGRRSSKKTQKKKSGKESSKNDQSSTKPNPEYVEKSDIPPAQMMSTNQSNQKSSRNQSDEGAKRKKSRQRSAAVADERTEDEKALSGTARIEKPQTTIKPPREVREDQDEAKGQEKMKPEEKHAGRRRKSRTKTRRGRKGRHDTRHHRVRQGHTDRNSDARDSTDQASKTLVSSHPNQDLRDNSNRDLDREDNVSHDSEHQNDAGRDSDTSDVKTRGSKRKGAAERKTDSEDDRARHSDTERSKTRQANDRKHPTGTMRRRERPTSSRRNKDRQSDAAGAQEEQDDVEDSKESPVDKARKRGRQDVVSHNTRIQDYYKRQMARLEYLTKSSKRPDDSKQASERPDESKRDRKRTDEPKRDSKRPDDPTQDSKRPDDPKQDGGRTDNPKRDSKRTDDPKQDGRRTDNPKRESKHTDNPKRNSKRPDDPKQDGGRTDNPKRESKLTDDPKQDGRRTDNPKRESKRTDNPKRNSKRPDDPKQNRRHPEDSRRDGRRPDDPRLASRRLVDSRQDSKRPGDSRRDSRRPGDPKHDSRGLADSRYDSRRPDDSRRDGRRPDDPRLASRRLVDSRRNSRRPDDSRHDSRRPDDSRRDSRRPDDSRRDSRRPDDPRLASRRLVDSRRDSRRPDDPRLDSRRSDDSRRDSRRPDDPRLDSRRSDDSRRDSRRPDDPRLASRRLVDSRRDSRRPDDSRRDSRRPDDPRLASSLVDSRRDSRRPDDSRRDSRRPYEPRSDSTRPGYPRHDSRRHHDPRYNSRRLVDRGHDSRRPDYPRPDSRRHYDPRYDRRRPDDPRYDSRRLVDRGHDSRRLVDRGHDSRHPDDPRYDNRRRGQSGYDSNRQAYERRRLEYERRRQEHERRRQEYERRRQDFSRYDPRLRTAARRRYFDAGRNRDVPSRPAAADRLEGRLFPSLTSSTHTLMRSMQSVLSTLTNALRVVRQDNDFVFNGTRYTIMMGVRQQLQDIAKANDMVYDTILRATLLTKDIYMRAHQHRLTGPTTRSLERPEMSLPSLYEVIRSAYDEERLAKQSLRSAQGLIRQRERVAARLQQVREKFQDDFARNDLRTLAYYINSTNQRLSTELAYSTHAAFMKRNTQLLQASQNNLTVARDLLYKASNNLASASADYRGNYGVIQDWRRLRNGNGGAPATLRRRGRAVSFRRDQPVRKLSAAERARLRPIIDRLKRHAQEQERLAMQAEMILRPAIRRAQLLTQTDEVAASAWMISLISRLERDGKKIYSLLDSIRVLIGSEDVLRWRVVQGGCPDGGYDTEGSGCELEGSGDLVLEGDEEVGSGSLPGSITDDEDFVFVNETGLPVRRVRPTSLAKFGTQLSVYVDGMKLRSHDVLQQSDKLADKADEMAQRWSRVRKSYDALERAQKSWKQTQETKQNVTQFVDDIRELIPAFSEEVSRSHDSIKSRMKKAVAIAERKLAEAQANKAGGEPTRSDTPPNNDDAVVLEAVEKVETVRKQTGVISSLRQVAPQSCGQASAQLMKLHSNISHLRQQVDTAKALLQSMQLSISKAGSGYLSIPVFPKTFTSSSSNKATQVPSHSLPPTMSLVTTVEVCVKTKDINGPVLLVKGNNSASFSLSMDDRQISVTVYDAEGYDLDTVTSDVTMEEDKWYNVKVTRTGKRVLLQVTSHTDKDSTADNDVTISSMSYLQPTPVHVYVGGVDKDEPFSVRSDSWRGCLGELRVNGHAVSLLNAASSGEAPRVCSSQCAPAPDGKSLVFDGVGFLHFPASVLPMRKSMQSVHFRFRTRQSSAALLHVVNQRQKFLLRVVLTDGVLMIDTTSPTESITLRSRNSSFNDGAFHTLKIQYRRSATYPEIDGQAEAFTVERARPRSIRSMADGITVGAFVTSSHAFEKSKFRPLIGCLQELAIDDRPLSMTQAVAAVGVFSGTCDTRRVWYQCRRFGTDSTGIDLGSLDRSGTVLLLFSDSSRGPLLTYTRDGKYEAEIVATDEGLQVTTEEDDLTIARPDDVTNPFTMFAVTDDGSTVTYSAWGEEVQTSYGGFWGAKSDVDGEHRVTVALPLDSASGVKFSGDLSQLMVGDRFIDLTNYTISNDLTTCQRPLPDLVMSETVPEMTSPSTDDEEETCSRDIQC